MKTPREILLARHRAAGPKLDAIRRAVVMSELNNEATKEQRRLRTATIGVQRHAAFVAWFLGCSNTLWRELILPSHRIWSGLAAAWLLIIVVNVSQRDHSPAVKYSSAPVMMSLREQQRLMNELFADRAAPVDAEPPKTFTPKPRTEKAEAMAV